MEPPAIEASGLWKTYDGSRYVLRGVDLRVPTGGVTVIWGANGSGKTTLLNILGGLDRPTRGSVAFAGRDITALGEAGRAKVRRDLVGFVFQGPNLIEDLTVRENIALPLRISRSKNGDSRLRELLTKFVLEGVATKRPKELSGGQLQRVALARALANRPRIILADEPTISLDPEASETVLDLIAGAAGEGAAAVIASHDPLVLRRSTTALRLGDGLLVARKPLP